MFHGDVDHLLSAYGVWAVFALVGIESLGVPVPGETILVAAGIYAGTTHHIQLASIVAAAAAGAIVGDNIGFWVGRTGGTRLLARYGHHVRLDDRKLKVGRYLFDRHGISVVFFGRFVSILRTYAAFLAGANRMRWPHFLFANAAGAVVWATAFGVGSYELGDAAKRLRGPIDVVFGVVALGAIVAAVVYLRRNERALEERAARVPRLIA